MDFNEICEKLCEITTVYSPSHIFNIVCDRKEEDFADTSKFVLRLVFLFYGLDALSMTWEELQLTLLKDEFRIWFWRILSDGNLRFLPDHVQNTTLVKRFVYMQPLDHESIFEIDPMICYVLLRIQAILFFVK